MKIPRRRRLISLALASVLAACSTHTKESYIGTWSGPDQQVTLVFDSNGTGRKRTICDDGSTIATDFTWQQRNRAVHISEYIGNGLESVFLEYDASIQESVEGSVLQVKIYDYDFTR